MSSGHLHLLLAIAPSRSVSILRCPLRSLHHAASNRQLVLVIAAACSASPRQVPPLRRSRPKGHLLIIGGNGTTADIVSRAVEAAGGQAGRVAIFPQASELAGNRRQRRQDVDRRRASGRAVVAGREGAGRGDRGGQGGDVHLVPRRRPDQADEGVRRDGHPEAIRARYAEGALVGGTSAGAAVMSKLMITGDAFDLQSITAGKTDTKPGPRPLPGGDRRSALPQAPADEPPDQRGARPPGRGGRRHRRNDGGLRQRRPRASRCSARAAWWSIDARKAAVDKTPAGQTGDRPRASS